MGLRERVESRTSPVGVVGLGYVGVPLAIAAAEAGFTVHGVDVDHERVDLLKRGKHCPEGTDVELMTQLVVEGRLHIHHDPGVLTHCEIICICVPTPLTRTREPDISYIQKASDMISESLSQGPEERLVVLESTSFPGTTREVVLPRLMRSGRTLCSDFHLAFSPERVDPGNRTWNLKNTPKLVGGLNGCCGRAAATFYSCFVDKVVEVSNPETAEMAKLLENIFRGVNIALVNELWMLCERMGLDVWEVIEAASTKPFGFMTFWPGPGLGGHCIPVDPFYLSWKAREYDFQTEFIELAGKINTSMPYFVVGLIGRALNREGRCLRGATVGIVGVAYKPGVSDTRETPAAKVMELLHKEGARVLYHDPYVPEFKLLGNKLFSEPLEKLIASSDCLAILTDHPGVDYRLLMDSEIPVVDTRNAMRRHGRALGKGDPSGKEVKPKTGTTEIQSP